MRSEVRWVALAVVGAAIGWLALRSAPSGPESPAPTPATQLEGTALPAPPSGAATLATPNPSAPASSREDEPGMRPPPVALSTGTLAWEQQLADAAKGRDGAARARAIFQMLPKLPEEALATAAEQAIDRLPHADYPAIATPVVTDPNTHAQALAVLFADLMERPDAVTLPALLAIARNPAHPYASAARDNLNFVLRVEHGEDWAKWEAAIRARLQSAPSRAE